MAAAALVPGGAAAQSPPDATTKPTEVVIEVLENGDLLISDTRLCVVENSNNPIGSSRYEIPLVNVDSIDSVALTKNDLKHPFTPEHIASGDALRIRWGVDGGIERFNLWYRIRGGLRLDENGDRAVWGARFTPSPRCRDSKAGRATMILPDSLAGQMSDFRVSGKVDSDSVTINLIDPRTVTADFNFSDDPQEITVQGAFPHGLLDVPTPYWQQSWVQRRTRDFLRQTPSEHVAWILRFLWVIVPLALLPVIRRKINRSWPMFEYPNIAGRVTGPPSDLPAPAVSLLVESGKVSDRTLLTLLVDMANKGILEVSAHYGRPSSDQAGNYTYRFVSRSNPQISNRFNWENLAIRAVQSNSHTLLEYRKKDLQNSKENIAIALGEHLESAGLFDRNPVQVRLDTRPQFWGLVLGAVLSGVGFIVLSDLFLPLLLSIPAGIGFAFCYYKLSSASRIGKLAPTEAGLREISQWLDFGERVSKPLQSRNPDDPTPILPYAVAFDAAEPWLTGTPTPSWFVLDGATGNRGLAYLGFLSAMDWELDGGSEFTYEAVMRRDTQR